MAVEVADAAETPEPADVAGEDESSDPVAVEAADAAETPEPAEVAGEDESSEPVAVEAADAAETPEPADVAGEAESSEPVAVEVADAAETPGPAEAAEGAEEPEPGAEDSEGAEEPEVPVIQPVEGAQWFILQTYSGFELRVQKTIEEKLRVQKLAHLVEEIFVPGEDVTRVKNGRKRVQHVIYFPGYVLIKMDLQDELWHLLMDIPRVAGFVGGKNNDPQPLSEDELGDIRSQMSQGIRQAKIKDEFEVGQQVMVIDGPFANFSGKIDEINTEKSKLRILISILGRSTPVELDFGKVKAHHEEA